MFEKDQILVSKNTGKRVRFIRYNFDDTDHFEGVEIGSAQWREFPANFHVRWHAWRSDAFEIEKENA